MNTFLGFSLFFVFFFSNFEALAQSTPCSDRAWPASLGGSADARVDELEAARWVKYREAREQERLEEALDPQRVISRFRLSLQEVLDRCIQLPQLIDLGRALFLRRFTRGEGFGNGLPDYPRRSRFQRGHFGGPDASSCVDCHWKGGFAGAGDRVDNTYAFGDGDTLTSADPRNPPPLWGVGWVELVAQEMTASLQSHKAEAQREAKASGIPVQRELVSKDVHFGFLIAHPDGTFDYSEVEGVDHDLIIKPFGWKGVFPTLREFVEISAHKHLGLQSDHLVSSPYREVDVGREDSLDPDQDQVTSELSEGQVLALVSFLATLDTPQIEVPKHGVYQETPRFGALEFVDTPSFTDRWLKGSRIFNEIGCAECHRPFLEVKSPILSIPLYQTETGSPQVVHQFTLDLSKDAAQPHPERKRDEAGQDYWLVPVFSDFKRHRMGEHLKSKHRERNVPEEVYLTRRLWGLRKTTPYLHHGGAMRFEEAVAAHGGAGSEALQSAEQFKGLNYEEQSSIRLFLSSLSRGPAIRIR